MDPGKDFEFARELLRKAQRGHRSTEKTNWPVLVDIGGFDPLADSGAVPHLLGLQVLRTLVNETASSPAREEWALLEDSRVCERVRDILSVVSLDGRPVLWRQLWELMADLWVGSKEDIPWYERLFLGRSSLSERIRNLLPPDDFVFPDVDGALWEGRWSDIAERVVAGAVELPSTLTSQSHDEEQLRRLQRRYLYTAKHLPPGATQSRKEVPWNGKPDYAVKRLVSAINKYMTYRAEGGTIGGSSQLGLWFNFEVEPRIDRPPGQVCLDTVPSAKFEIRQSLSVNNHPSGQDMKGSRWFLVHTETLAAIELSAHLWTRLCGTRSFKVKDRLSRELDIELERFFYRLLRTDKQPVDDVPRLTVLKTDFGRLSSTHRTYVVSESQVEEAN
jgi:hypothetical protein